MDSVLRKRVRPEWDEAERVWEESAAFLPAHGFSADLSFALSMVASELVENAVKYGDYGRSDRDISIAIEVGTTDITIEIRNPIDQASEHFHRLDAIIQWIRGFQNPFEAYVERLKAVSESSLGQGESGLGLVRVAYEAQAILDFYVDESETLALSAVFQR
jgi:hypothetical protein